MQEGALALVFHGSWRRAGALVVVLVLVLVLREWFIGSTSAREADMRWEKPGDRHSSLACDRGTCARGHAVMGGGDM